MTGASGTPAGRPSGAVAGTTAAGPAPSAGSEAVDEAAAPAGDGATGPAARRRRLRRGGRRTWLALAAAVVVGALVLAVVMLVRTPSDAEVRESALVAARTYATSLTTFDARTLDADVERVRRASTPGFAEEYEQTIAELRPTVEAEQTVSSGSVVGAGVEELGEDTATVLVAVNQQLASATAQPRTEANRLRMVLERRDGRWLIRDVERL